MLINRTYKIIRGPVRAAALSLLVTAGAHAAGSHAGGHGSQIGMPGKPGEVTRTIEVVMADIRFTPESLTVKKGETVRFKIRNEGRVVHEFNIGTAAMHAAHQKEMAMMVEHGALGIDNIHHDKMNVDMGGGHVMKHDDPNSILLEPGKSAELVWKFSTDTKLEFACNVPGHYDAGMVGTIRVN